MLNITVLKAHSKFINALISDCLYFQPVNISADTGEVEEDSTSAATEIVLDVDDSCPITRIGKRRSSIQLLFSLLCLNFLVSSFLKHGKFQ